MSALLKLGELTSGVESKKYYKEYAQLSDSLNNRERYYKNQFAKVRYETEKKDKLNADLQQENRLKAQDAENQRQQKIIFALLGVLGVVFIFVYSFNRRKKMMYEAQLQKASAREEERNRISQELHDGVLSRLFGTRVSLGFLELQEDEEIKKQHELLLKELQDIEKEIRDISHQLNDHIDISNTSFTMILKKLLESKSMLGNFQYKFQTEKHISWKNIDETIKVNLYRIIQEALQNIIKHAEASVVVLKISRAQKTLLIKIEDNGVGFDLKRENEGIGIKNIYSRAKTINGEIEIFSEPTKGTTITIKLPLVFAKEERLKRSQEL